MLVFPPGQLPPSNPRLPQFSRRRQSHLTCHPRRNHTQASPRCTSTASHVTPAPSCEVGAYTSQRGGACRGCGPHALRGRDTAGLVEGRCRLDGGVCGAAGYTGHSSSKGGEIMYIQRVVLDCRAGSSPLCTRGWSLSSLLRCMYIMGGYGMVWMLQPAAAHSKGQPRVTLSSRWDTPRSPPPPPPPPLP